jgi:hypothetical protein
METVRTSETSVDNHFTWQYIPEDNTEHHTRRRENLKSHREESLVWIGKLGVERKTVPLRGPERRVGSKGSLTNFQVRVEFNEGPLRPKAEGKQ